MTWWRALSIPWKATVVIAVLTAIVLYSGPTGSGYSNDPGTNRMTSVIVGVILNGAIVFVVTWVAVWTYRKARR